MLQPPLSFADTNLGTTQPFGQSHRAPRDSETLGSHQTHPAAAVSASQWEARVLPGTPASRTHLLRGRAALTGSCALCWGRRGWAPWRGKGTNRGMAEQTGPAGISSPPAHAHSSLFPFPPFRHLPAPVRHAVGWRRRGVWRGRCERRAPCGSVTLC